MVDANTRSAEEGLLRAPLLLQLHPLVRSEPVARPNLQEFRRFIHERVLFLLLAPNVRTDAPAAVVEINPRQGRNMWLRLALLIDTRKQ